MVPRGNMGRRKRAANHSPHKNIVQDLEQNEENRYPNPNSNKTEINYSKESNEDHKKTLKEEILQVINENFIQVLLDMVNKTYREHSRNSKKKKLKNMRKYRNK
jgi:hypothetical protein